MKHKTQGKPALVIALGAPADNAGGVAGDPTARAKAGSPHEGGEFSPDADNMDTVPLDALAMPDDQEQMQPPQVGDVVNYQVTGKVTAIEGDVAKVLRTSINGQDLPGQPEETNGDNDNPENANQDQDGDESAGLRREAAGIGMM